MGECDHGPNSPGCFYCAGKRKTGSKSALSEGLSCVHLNEDGSCGEPEYAGCEAWVDWNANSRIKEPADFFCKLSRRERRGYAGQAR